MPVAKEQMTDMPEWFDGKKINEVLFCQSFLETHPMKCIQGRFFTVDGLVDDEESLRMEIYDRIKDYTCCGIAKKASQLLDALKLACYSPPLPVQLDRIHVANGTYYLDGRFTEEKEYCMNRLKVQYDPNASVPEKWISFVNDLLTETDVLTLQEYMGYCLIPTNKAQKMLLILGKGGEGKSRVGLVLRSILGDSMNTSSIQKVETNRFARADLEYKLLMVDDDMKMVALPQTSNIKTIVTLEDKMDIERKGQQSIQRPLYVRFLCFGNGSLSALYDRSYGFYRRQIILTTKERDSNRRDDQFLAEKLKSESEGIFLWCLVGLQRLIQNNYEFTISDAAKSNLEEAISDSNNIPRFLESEGYFRFKADGQITSKELYALYELWCDENSGKAVSPKSFGNYMCQNEKQLNLERSNNVRNRDGRRVWGFWGMEPVVKLYV